MEKCLEALVETEDMLKDCEEVLGTLSDNLPANVHTEERQVTEPPTTTQKKSKLPGDPLLVETLKPSTSPSSSESHPAYTFYSTILANCNDVQLNSEHLLNLANQNEWLETEIVDFYCRYLQQKGNLKNQITITPSAYVYLTNREENLWVRARQGEIPWVDNLVLFDVQQQNKHIHPLLLNNHFVLLELDRQSKVCTVYDSFKNERENNQPGILENDKFLIKTHVLPDFFMDTKEVIPWEVKYFEDMPQQTDHINCGVFVMSAARDIMNGVNSYITKPKCVESLRTEFIREILLTTENGQNLLVVAGDDDKKLKSYIQEDALKAKKARKEFYDTYYPHLNKN